LAEHTAAQALFAGAKPEQPQLGIDIAIQHRGQLRVNIGDARKRTDDQRYRRHRLVRFGLLVGRRARPLRLHRQRILANRDADVELRTQLHADRFDGIEQQRVFTGKSGRRHPVGGEFHFRQRRHRRSGEVGQGFAHRHARGRGRIDQGQWCAFADRHRFASKAVKIGEGDRAIGQR
jgi:hypothetical protein